MFNNSFSFFFHFLNRTQDKVSGLDYILDKEQYNLHFGTPYVWDPIMCCHVDVLIFQTF